ncbi:MAG TPA: LacI family DNA-binding transcriptional regulator, partial [Stellaceae bacterium]|nr:LacI family DNA-binding transcriptional regulator [Stellaceae bacterium]
MSRPRIEDVAALAGTSPITVSRVLRAPGKVAPATRAKVAAAIEQLGYIPNLSASSLASRRSGIVGLLVPTIDNSIFAATVQGMSDAVADAGLQLLLGDFRYSEEGERALVRALIGRQPEALVVVGVVRDRALRQMLQSLAIPVVETWDLTDDPIDTVVGFSNEAAGAAMARHLLDCGRRRLAFVGGPDHRAQARRAGFAAVLERAGAAPPVSREIDAISIAAGRGALAATLEETPAIDAVFFATDVLAVGGLMECQHRGIAVPERLAIAGLGDLEIARELSPSLTTVRIPAYEIGRRAGEVVATRL